MLLRHDPRDFVPPHRHSVARKRPKRDALEDEGKISGQSLLAQHDRCIVQQECEYSPTPKAPRRARNSVETPAFDDSGLRLKKPHGVGGQTAGSGPIHCERLRHCGDRFHRIAENKPQPEIPVFNPAKRRIKSSYCIEGLSAKRHRANMKCTPVTKHWPKYLGWVEPCGRLHAIKRRTKARKDQDRPLVL